MTTLGELYSSLDTLNKLGLDTTELEKKIQEEETRVLHEEITTSIKDVADVLFHNFRRDVIITISHKTGCPISVQVGGTEAKVHTETGQLKSYDKTTYIFEGSGPLNKRRFALALVKRYVEDNPNIDYSGLKQIFTPSIISGRGVVRSITDLNDIKQDEIPKRYLMKDEDLINLSNGDIITVCSQWNPERIAKMVDLANTLGYQVHEQSNDENNEASELNPAKEVKLDGHSYIIENDSTEEPHIFMVRSQKGAYGKGIYDNENNTFKLLAGSIISPTTSNTFNRKGTYDEVINQYCHYTDGGYKLVRDYVFNSPSTASSVVLGRSSNGWGDWKDKYGKSLNEVYPR